MTDAELAIVLALVEADRPKPGGCLYCLHRRDFESGTLTHAAWCPWERARRLAEDDQPQEIDGVQV